MVVSEPRRNRLIAEDGDKDDDIDAEKLAQLLRGGGSAAARPHARDLPGHVRLSVAGPGTCAAHSPAQSFPGNVRITIMTVR